MLPAAISLSLSTATAQTDNPYEERSLRQLPIVLAFDSRLASALRARSLPELRGLREDVGRETENSEALVSEGGTAVACDVALFNLDLIAAFSINKLDGEGRYEDWMEGESIRLLADYRELVDACGKDAGEAATSSISTDMIEGL